MDRLEASPGPSLPSFRATSDAEPDGAQPVRRRPLLAMFPPEGGTRLSAPAAPGSPPLVPPPALSFDRALSNPSPYELFYGLAERAFGPSPDPKFLFHSGTHDRATADLLDAIRRRDGFVVLAAAEGLGKTMVCRALVEQLDRRTIASLVTHPFLSSEDLLKAILVDFGAIAERDLTSGHLVRVSRVELAGALHNFLMSLAPLGAFAVVIIDEAHLLPVAVLQQLWTLANAEFDARRLQVVLVGTPDLLTTLARPELAALATRINVSASLSPLGREEVAEYVVHRLAVAGRRQGVSFEVDAIERLYELSQGVPRAVNQLCDGALEVGHQDSTSLIDVDLVDRSAAAQGLLSARPTSSSLRERLGVAAALVALALLGAAMAALLFRTRIDTLLGP